jgi:hypothetical protein
MLRIIIYFVEAMASNFFKIFFSQYCDVAQVAIIHNNIKPIFVEKS